MPSEMDRIIVRITGHEAVQHKLEQGTRISRALPGAMKHAVLYTQSTIPPYPPPPAMSRYRRTNTLGRSVTSLQGQAKGALSRVESVGTGSVGYLGTNVVYAPYVIDENNQAWMHKGRWYTLQAVVQKAKPQIIKILRERVLDYLGM